MRPLDLINENDRTYPRVAGAVVVEAPALGGEDDEDGWPEVRAVTDGVFEVDDDDEDTPVHIGYTDGDHVHEITLADGEESITVAPDATTMTIRGAEGRDYTVRRLVDEDGLWASGLQMNVPADALEDLYGGDVENPSESFWAALDPDTEQFRELIYTSPRGVYARSNGNWHRYPDEDESLDGLESITVTPRFLDVFDKSETRGTQLDRDTVVKYQADDDTESA